MPKIAIIILFALLPLNAFASGEVYYCTDETAIGFEPSENYSQKLYHGERFTAKIDFDEPSVIAEKIFLDFDQECFYGYGRETVYCISGFGRAFAIHRDTLKYHSASVFLVEKTTDTIAISHGSCEKF